VGAARDAQAGGGVGGGRVVLVVQEDDADELAQPLHVLRVEEAAVVRGTQ
jgi:hypothetical protein